MTDKTTVPAHVSIIMDGNGRWATLRGQERIFGHKEGCESVRACTEFAIQKGIRYLSLFAFSEENWSRPKEEVEGLMQIMIKSIRDETPTFEKNGIRFMALGDFSRLSQALQMEIKECMELTEHNHTLTLIIFISYSGKWDIIQAVNRIIAEKGEEGKGLPQIDQNLIDKYLCTAGIPDPDLLIRTSGEERISNFLLWQTAYSEYYFTKTLWPDFRKTEFQNALVAYSKRDRRFGKV
jgi:undecaprenyl diphosphate synthase